VSYPVDIAGAIDALGSSVIVSDEITLPAVDLGDEHFEPQGPATFEVKITNAGAGLVAQGQVSALMHVVCARCLVRFEYQANGAVEGFYVAPGDEADLPEEQEFEHVRDGRVDLEPALVQALVVDLPFAPLCSEGCRGLCPGCGADLNEGDCGCRGTDDTHPFARLGELLEGDEEATPGPKEAADPADTGHEDR
jgi:uncharacterized protein